MVGARAGVARWRWWGAALGVVSLVTLIAPADEPRPAPPPPTEPAPEPTSDAPVAEPVPAPVTEPIAEPAPAPRREPVPLPSLDDLLDLPRSTPAEEGEAPEAPADELVRDLERRLAGEEINDRFAQAVDFMSRSAERLRSRDVGLTTQRLQEDALDRLDWLIENAERQQSQSQSSSSSSQDDPQDADQPAQPQAGQAQQEARGDGEQETMPPGRRDGELNPLRAAAEAAWGALPERVRESLLQGSGDEFSEMYRAMTERYYRRLAEEGGS